jgi:glutamyl-tRNA synthetase
VAVLGEIVALVDFLFLRDDQMTIDEAAWEKATRDGAGDMLAASADALEGVSTWDADTLKSTVESVGLARGLKLGKAQAPVRVAVTGRSVGLPLFESLAVLGRDRTLDRIRAAAGRYATA